MKPLFESVQEEYEQKYKQYMEICVLATNLEDKEIFNLAVKRLAGVNAMMDYMTENKSKYVK